MLRVCLDSQATTWRQRPANRGPRPFALGNTLVTDSEREFASVPGLTGVAATILNFFGFAIKEVGARRLAKAMRKKKISRNKMAAMLRSGEGGT